MNDCAKYLNGRGVGSRYDGTFPGSTRVGSCAGKTGKASTFSAAYKALIGQFWEAQARSFEQGQGWIQWTWKTELTDEWSYQAGLANGWIPKNPTVYQYANPCTSVADITGALERGVFTKISVVISVNILLTMPALVLITHSFHRWRITS